jgi:hypothetical protein
MGTLKMRRVPLLLGPGCAVALVLACFHSVLFREHQFAYRDAGHFFYPLYRMVQQEWAAGRLPIWNPWQNGGTPLLGLPMAAVLYPGKLLYAVLPYPQAARSYVLAHTIIALLGMFALVRTLGLSGTASMLSALSYAFGAPVLSLYGNVIFLVGAAWAPWGFRAIYRLAGPGHRWAVIELSVVLALQVLGGDPESAYLTMASGALYAGFVVSAREGPSGVAPGPRRALVPVALALVAVWFGLALGADYAAGRRWTRTWQAGGPFLWCASGLGLAGFLVWRSRRMLGGLVGAGLLAVLLTAIQIGPTWEYARQSTRLTGPAASATYDFSVEPYRLVEAVWPYVFGLEVPENASWIQALPPEGERMIWSPSLYVGGFVLVLAVGGAGLRGGPNWRRWLTILALVGLIGGMGKFAGPLWWARRIPGAAAWLGAPDPPPGLSRSDAFLPDGVGSLYGALAMFLPGFAMFRYPAKLLVFAGLCGSVLAGLGWDRLCRADSTRLAEDHSAGPEGSDEAPGALTPHPPFGHPLPGGARGTAVASAEREKHGGGVERLPSAPGETDGVSGAARSSPSSRLPESPWRTTRRWCLAGLAASVGLVVVILARRAAIEQWVGRHVPPGSLYGPVDPARAVDQTLWALIQGGAVYAAGTALATLATLRPSWAGAGALVLVTADLALAGCRIVWTVPESDLDATPLIARLINRAEQSEPAPGPFRVHRVEQWHPDEFSRQRSPLRLSEVAAWERDTLDRLHAEPFGLPYTVIRGVIDIGDYLDFFEARATWGRDDRGIERPVYSFPRGGYDLWNARYFIMPVGLNGWMGPERGFTRIAPPDEVVREPERARSWIDRQGWQLLRNDRAFPRCWVVPSAVIVPPTAPGSPARAELVRHLVDFAGAGGFDPRRMAFVETDDPRPLAALDRPPPAGPIGTATIVRFDPQRVEIRAALTQTGLVILSDALDPGWQLTIEGTPAPIWRTNRLMRGALVSAGDHTLVYTYRPGAFRVGAVISMAGLLVLGGLVCRAAMIRAPRRDSEGS